MSFLESFDESVGFREKIFIDTIVEKSLVSIKQEIIIDFINLSDIKDASDETDSISIDRHVKFNPCDFYYY